MRIGLLQLCIIFAPANVDYIIHCEQIKKGGEIAQMVRAQDS